MGIEIFQFENKERKEQITSTIVKKFSLRGMPPLCGGSWRVICFENRFELGTINTQTKGKFLEKN